MESAKPSELHAVPAGNELQDSNGPLINEHGDDDFAVPEELINKEMDQTVQSGAEFTNGLAQRQQEETKMPVFLGCADPALFGAIKALIDENPEFAQRNEIAVMSREVYQASVENWYMNKLGKDEKNRIEEMKKNEIKHAEALEQANEIYEFFWPRYSGFQTIGEEEGANRLAIREEAGFRAFELKKYYNEKRTAWSNRQKANVVFSNANTRHLIDFLCAHKFMFPTKADTGYDKQIFVMTLQPSDRIKHLQTLHKDYENIQNVYIERLATINQEISQISAQMIKEADEELPNEKNVAEL